MTPTRLGRYEIVEELGKGAMGVVYLARDPLIGRLVALKTFRIGYSIRDHELQQFRARFIREAQSAGILSHPGIVTIHDVVEESEDGMAFIAMEYVRGTNLKQILQSGQPMPLTRVGDIVTQVADALDYAHSQGVIHRDIKPANIILTADNRVKITDFGIAKLDTSNLTQEGQLLGTPNYMAPEQIQGREVDHRADLFALGVMLYEMLTRHKPFQGENLTVVSHRIVYDHFTPPRDYVKDLPPPIEKVLTRALEKEPANRYQRAREMSEELRRAVSQSVATDDLNETQSLSSTMMLPAGSGPADGSSASLGSGSGSGSAGASTGTPVSTPLPSLPPLPAPPALPANTEAGEQTQSSQITTPPAAPAPSRRISPWRIAIAAGLSALLLLGGSLGLTQRDRETPQERAKIREMQKKERTRPIVMELIRQGHQLMRSGDAKGAAARYLAAEQIAPDLDVLRRMHAQAEKESAELERLVGQEQEIAKYLLAATESMRSRRYPDAMLAVASALQLDPTNPDAQQLLTQIKEAQARQAQAPVPGLPRPGATPDSQASVPAAPDGSGAERPAEEARTATLTLLVESRMMGGGDIRLMADGAKLYQGKIAPARTKGGFLKKRKVVEAAVFTQSIQVPASSGLVTLAVYVTPKGKTAVTRSVDGNFPGGSSRELKISIGEDNTLSLPALN
ncbi:MAG TPA: protein kinase [Thermoanaerobaculia bacterium]|nr:protein kinase [Thermoanaerobaculia bacterium]